MAARNPQPASLIGQYCTEMARAR